MEEKNILIENNLFYQGGNAGVDGNLYGEDPLFTDVSANDFTLRVGSPAIDAGDPDAMYNDPDGSRNDMGYMPFGG